MVEISSEFLYEGDMFGVNDILKIVYCFLGKVFGINEYDIFIYCGNHDEDHEEVSSG
jgi:hypothetical protein